jgi:imidazolonepropionase-like amidohydrolase
LQIFYRKSLSFFFEISLAGLRSKERHQSLEGKMRRPAYPGFLRGTLFLLLSVFAAGAWLAGARKTLAQAAPQEPRSNSFVIRNARIFDGARVMPREDVWVESGRIKAVGTDLKVPASTKVVDGTGDTLLAGLIDAHTHTFSEAQLKAALIFGVTTELDMFTDHNFAQKIKQDEAAGKDLDFADLRSAGTLVTAPHGHGTEYGMAIPTITSPVEAQVFVDARIAEGSDYIKIILDDGGAYVHPTPTLSKETLAAVIAAAHQRGKLAVVHIGSLAGAREAIEAGADGLMHLFVDQAPDPQFAAFAAAHHVFVVPTLEVNASVAGKVAGAGLLDDARLSDYMMPDDAVNLKASFPKIGTNLKYEYAEQAVRDLKAVHVPLLAGTDAPNPGTAHGVSLQGELELLVHAGLTPAEALTAATSAPARAFRLNDRGEIVTGRRADLLLVRGDPTTDIRATRDIVGVWKQGVLADRDAYRAEVVAKIKARSSAPQASDSVLVSDFEDGTTAAKFGAGWSVSTDDIAGGKSTGAMAVTDDGAQGSHHSLLISGKIDPAVPYAWAGAMFSPGVQPFVPANLSSRKQIHFWAKGDGKTYRVLLFAQSHGYTPSTQTFATTSEWKEYWFPISAFKMDGSDLTAVLFCGGPATGDFSFQIDNVRIE